MDAFSAKSAAEKYLFDTTDIASTVVMLITLITLEDKFQSI